jgi:hypothetical protein
MVVPAKNVANIAMRIMTGMDAPVESAARSEQKAMTGSSQSPINVMKPAQSAELVVM